MNYDELNKINELREKGIITDEEFQREKERILNAENVNSQYQNSQYQNYQAYNNNYNNQSNQYNDVKYGEVQYSNNNTPGAKSKLVAGLLGIFVGAFGVHNFYLGYYGKAVAQLLISILSCGILAAASSIWGLIEGVMILMGEIKTDANGIELKD